MFSSIIVLCIGNICRSPLAEAYLRSELQSRQKMIKISSAGLHAMHNYPADENSCKIATNNNLHLEEHKAQQVTQDLLNGADLILVMTKNQLKQVHQDYPSTRGKVFLVHNNPAQDIPDPYKKEAEAFDEAWNLIKTGIDGWVKMLAS